MSEESKKEEKVTNKSFDVVRVFAKEQTIFGLPGNVFVMGVGVALVIIFFLEKLLGIFFLVIYLKVMYTIHEDDPKALEVWISALRRRVTGWGACKVKTTKLVIF